VWKNRKDEGITKKYGQKGEGPWGEGRPKNLLNERKKNLAENDQRWDSVIA